MTDQKNDILPPTPASTELARSRAMTRWLGRPHPKQRQLFDRFIAALATDFEAGGPEAIATLRRYDPVNYLRLIAVMVPRQLVDATAANMDYDEEIADALDRVQDLADAFAAGIDKDEQGQGPHGETPALPALPEAV